MKTTIALIIAACLGFVACNNNDTSKQGVVDSSKATIDTPKAVVADSSTMIMHDTTNKK